MLVRRVRIEGRGWLMVGWIMEIYSSYLLVLLGVLVGPSWLFLRYLGQSTQEQQSRINAKSGIIGFCSLFSRYGLEKCEVRSGLTLISSTSEGFCSAPFLFLSILQ